MAEAADTYLAAAGEEFWREAARLARRRLHPGPDQRAGDGGQASRAHPEPGPGASRTRAEDEDEDEDEAEAEGGDMRQDITDRATGLSRLLSERCSTCILRVVDCTCAVTEGGRRGRGGHEPEGTARARPGRP